MRRGKIRGTILITAVVLFAVSCSSKDEETAKRLLELESKPYGGTGAEDKRIAELKKDVARYRKIVEEKVKATEKLGSYYKLLALAYLDRGMYGEALAALEEAVKIHPEQAPLYLFKAIAAGRLSKAVSDSSLKEQYLKAAEQAYLRCIDLDPGANQALYGLAILYAFELDRPEEALPLLDKILQRERQNVDALFLLARVRYTLGYVEDALDAYDRIIATPAAGTRREEARKNKKLILEGAVR